MDKRVVELDTQLGEVRDDVQELAASATQQQTWGKQVGRGGAAAACACMRRLPFANALCCCCPRWREA